MKPISFLSIVLGGMLLLNSGCSKDNLPLPTDPKLPTFPIPPIPVCRLATISGSSGTTTTAISLTYNNDGDVSIIRQTGSNPFTKVLTYNGNTIKTVTTNQAGTVTRRDSIVLNSNKLIVFMESNDVSLNRKTINRFTYGSNGQLTQSTSQTGSGAVSTSTYTFNNGDLVAIRGAQNTSYTHYTDRLLTDGDFLKLFQLVNTGAFIVRNAHLVKSEQNGNSLRNFVYDFDIAGKIIKLTGTSGSTVETLEFSYECK